MSSAAVGTPARPGWFGKLPARGDFVVRRLPPAFVERWHAWCVEGLAAAQEALGAAWLDAYLVAPVRRYWLAPGVLGEGAWAGVWLPSVDRVGRHFPLTLAAPAQGVAPPAGAAARAWYDALAAAGCGVLDLEATIADLEDRLATLPPLPAPPPVVPAHAAALAGSLWWCEGEDAQQACTFAALPPPARYAKLLFAPRPAQGACTLTREAAP